MRINNPEINFENNTMTLTEPVSRRFKINLVATVAILIATASFAQLTSNTIVPAGVRIERAVEFLAGSPPGQAIPRRRWRCERE